MRKILLIAILLYSLVGFGQKIINIDASNYLINLDASNYLINLENSQQGIYNNWMPQSSYTINTNVNGNYMKVLQDDIIYRTNDDTLRIIQFDFYTPNLNSDKEINIIADTNLAYSSYNGFVLRFDANRRVNLFESYGGTGAALWRSNLNYIDDSVWYRIKIDFQNSYDSVYCYIKGGDFGNTYTLIETSYGDNPRRRIGIETSTYYSLNLDSLDCYSDKTIQSDINSKDVVYFVNKALDGQYLAKYINDDDVYCEKVEKTPVNINIDLSLDKKYVCFSWADFFDDDFDYIIPLLNKYDFINDFYFQTKPVSDSPLESLYDIDKVRQIERSGNYQATHEFLHYNYATDIPYADGINYPTNHDFREDRGDNKNEYGYDLSSTVEDSWTTSRCSYWLQLPDTTYEKEWQNLTDGDCDTIRKNMSIFMVALDPQSKQNVLQSLDSLSNIYLGTTGSSVLNYDYVNRLPNTSSGSYPADGDSIRGGIFQGAKTTKNHEIWERLQQIVLHEKRDIYKANKDVKMWTSSAGGGYVIHYRDANNLLYFDTAYTKLASGEAEFRSTITDSTRSINSILRELGYKTTMAAFSTSFSSPAFQISQKRYEGQRLYKRNVYRTRIDHVGDGFSKSLRCFNNILNQTEIDTILNAPDIPLALYNYTDTSSQFDSYTAFTGIGNTAEVLKKIVQYNAWGIIPEGVGDSGSDTKLEKTSFALSYESILDFCRRAGIKVISQTQAIEAVLKDSIPNGVNIFPNPDFENTFAEVFAGMSIPITYPDGWNGGYVSNDTLILDNSTETDETYFIRQYTAQYGLATLAFSAIGQAKVILKTIKNNDEYVEGSGYLFTNALEFNVNNSIWSNVSDTITIDNNPLVIYSEATDPVEDAAQKYWRGYDNKIIGFHIDVIVPPGEVFKLYNPSLIII